MLLHPLVEHMKIVEERLGCEQGLAVLDELYSLPEFHWSVFPLEHLRKEATASHPHQSTYLPGLGTIFFALIV